MLIALSNAFDRQGMDYLLYIHMTNTGGGMWYTADGVARFARLIAAGLVNIDERPSPDGPNGMRSGDEGEYQRLLEGNT
jgi:hypothetical protein